MRYTQSEHNGHQGSGGVYSTYDGYQFSVNLPQLSRGDRKLLPHSSSPTSVDGYYLVPKLLLWFPPQGSLGQPSQNAYLSQTLKPFGFNTKLSWPRTSIVVEHEECNTLRSSICIQACQGTRDRACDRKGPISSSLDTNEAHVYQSIRTLHHGFKESRPFSTGIIRHQNLPLDNSVLVLPCFSSTTVKYEAGLSRP